METAVGLFSDKAYNWFGEQVESIPGASHLTNRFGLNRYLSSAVSHHIFEPAGVTLPWMLCQV